MTRALPALVAVIAFGAAPAAMAAAPATATQPPRDVTRDGATLVARVDPNGAETSVRFDLGRTTEYGLQTETRSAGTGDAPVEVAIPVSGLAAGTSYHARAVATNADGSTTGSDVTFRTAAAPRAPAVRTFAARDVTGTAATLQARVDPNGSPTRFRFEWGTTTSYGRTTPDANAGASEDPSTVSARIGGLRAGRTYHFRVVATNAQGTVRGADRRFITGRGLSGISLTADPEPAVWGTAVRLTGRVAGAAPGGTSVALERQEVPFDGPFGQVGTARRSNRAGSFTFLLPVYRTVRVRVATRPSGAVGSAPLEIRVRPKVGAIVRRVPGALRFSGSVWPQLPQGRASLQRLSSTGRWVPVRRRALRPRDGGRSRYAIRVRRRSRTTTWRIVVTPNAGAAYLRGFSRNVTMRAR